MRVEGSPGAHRGVAPLEALEGLASELGARETAEEARAVAARVHEGRFFVVCLGQFKRGKSTLLNALVEAAVLPVGVTPVTAVVTVLRHGTALEARVRIGDEPWRRVGVDEVSAYVSEAENPENAKNVTGVEIFVPSPLLSSGLCLVDTPGIGSVFEGNTEATRAFVPHVDAALVVLGADPPISGDELRLVERVAKDVRDFVFVLAKADRLRDDETAQAKAFAERVLAKVVPSGVELIVVSATERIERGVPTRGWSPLVDTLSALARTRRSELVAAAEQRGALRLASALLREIAERRAALRRPREESERRLDALRASVKAAEKLLSDATPLFSAIEERLATKLERERHVFLSEAREAVFASIEHAVRELAERRGAQARVIEAAQSIGRDCIDSWRRASAPRVEQMYRDAVADLVGAASSVLRSVVTADPAFAAISTLDLEAPAFAPPHFYFTDMMTLSGPSLRTAVVGALGGETGRRKALLSRARPYLQRLVETNSARVTNDFIEQVRESRRHLEADIKRLLASLTSSASRALDEARRAQAGGAVAVADAERRLADAEAELRAICLGKR